VRPFQTKLCEPRANRARSTSRRTSRPFASIIVIVSRSAFRSLKSTAVESWPHSQRGEKVLMTLVPVIGLGASFSPSVTAKAAAVPPSRKRTSNVERNRATARRF